jgi:hypothetical protein
MGHGSVTLVGLIKRLAMENTYSINSTFPLNFVKGWAGASTDQTAIPDPILTDKEVFGRALLLLWSEAAREDGRTRIPAVAPEAFPTSTPNHNAAEQNHH